MDIYTALGLFVVIAWCAIMLLVVAPTFDKDRKSKVGCYVIACVPIITFFLGILGH